MKITEDVRKYATEQGIAEEEALKKGMEKTEVGRVCAEGRGGLREGVTPRAVRHNACVDYAVLNS